MFGLMAVTGMRIGEALKPGDGDVDTDSGTVRVTHGKNGRDRVVPVTDCTAERLQRHRDTRDRILGRKPEAFLCGPDGSRLCADTVRQTFARIGQRIGLREPRNDGRKGRGPHLHDLRQWQLSRARDMRHTAAMNLLRQGVPITVIALWLGHRSVESTMKYLHADPKIKEDAMERTRPVDVPPGRYSPEEPVMAFLESL